MLTQKQIDSVTAFHGHFCPGLAFGMRVGEWGLKEFGHAEDEEIVAVVETDMCAVDAIQFLTGCTFGKGNFVFLDYGKNAYTFFRRSDGKNARLMTRGGLLTDLREQQNRLASGETEEHGRIKQKMIERIMQTDFEDIFSMTPAQIPMPETARIYAGILCDQCGETAMSARMERINDRNLCVPCRKKNHRPQ
jgi:formylmethanofuran dehydrogenase subunit E